MLGFQSVFSSQFVEIWVERAAAAGGSLNGGQNKQAISSRVSRIPCGIDWVLPFLVVDTLAFAAFIVIAFHARIVFFAHQVASNPQHFRRYSVQSLGDACKTSVLHNSSCSLRTCTGLACFTLHRSCPHVYQHVVRGHLDPDFLHHVLPL